MPKVPKSLPRIGAHTPTSGGMAKRSLGYAETIKAEVIQVFTSNPRGWAMPEPNPAADEEFKVKAAAMDVTTYVHAPFLINLGSPVRRFRDINTVSGTSSYWVATVKVISPQLDLGNDSLGNPRVVTADSSIIQNDILNGGNY